MTAKSCSEFKAFFQMIRFASIDFSKSDVMFEDKMLRPVLKTFSHIKFSEGLMTIYTDECIKNMPT